MKRMKLNQKGFSLVELMVVVAIIGILATIGIPQYQKFMAKARQSEAKSHLNGIFQGEASFYTEYNQYTVDLKNIGASAVGKDLRYNAGFTQTACTNFSTVSAPAEAGAGTNDLVSLAGGTWKYTITDPGTSPTACDATSGAASYTAGAWGNPTNESVTNNNADQFTMDQTRNLKQVAVGI